jgi:hypothetical protein
VSAFAKGDARLIGVYSFSVEVPGYDGDPYPRKGKIRMLEGTGGAFCINEERDFNHNRGPTPGNTTRPCYSSSNKQMPISTPYIDSLSTLSAIFFAIAALAKKRGLDSLVRLRPGDNT